MKPFTFDLVTHEHVTVPNGGARFPEDFAQVVDPKGDKFRDDFTRACLYLATKYSNAAMMTEEDRLKATVIVASEYGNVDAMFRFQKQIWSNDGLVSAQQFPHATTSSASTFVNIDRKFRGGNATINSGGLNPAVAFFHALLHLEDFVAGSSHIFVGDVYSDISLEDLPDSSRTSTSEVSYTSIRAGMSYRAEFHFGAETEEASAGSTKRLVTSLGETNSAVPMKQFFESVRGLKPNESIAMVCSQDGRIVTTRVTAL